MKNSSMKNMVVAAACGVLLLSGCSVDEGSDGDGATPGPALVTMPVSESVLMVGGPVDEVSDEVLKGKPVFTNGCLGATVGDKTHLVVWPDGTSVAGAEDDALRVGDEVLAPGQSFTGRGTFIAAEPFPAEFPSIPLRCLGPTQEKIMWLQEITEITG